MTNISVSVDDEMVEWLDQLIKNGLIKNRSEAIRGGIYSFILDKLGFKSKADLRNYLKKHQKKDFQTGTQAIRAIREEE
ncbi:MAG: ribbon-helix-helix domain-containing protein [Promethearchaeota archaeon]